MPTWNEENSYRWDADRKASRLSIHWQILSIYHLDIPVFAVFARDRKGGGWMREVVQTEWIGTARARRFVWTTNAKGVDERTGEVDPIDSRVVALFIERGEFVVAQSLTGYLGICDSSSPVLGFNGDYLGEGCRFPPNEEWIDTAEPAERDKDRGDGDDEDCDG